MPTIRIQSRLTRPEVTAASRTEVTATPQPPIRTPRASFVLRAASIVLAAGICLVPPRLAQALGVGDPAPPFQLPWLVDAGQAIAPDLFWESEITAVVLWNRGCPRCAEIVATMPALSDSLARMRGRVVGIAFGPDDPVSLRAWLKEKGITVPQLWDADGGVAAGYGLGTRHLAVYLIDNDALVRSAFDDELPGLIEAVVPEARRLRLQRDGVPRSVTFDQSAPKRAIGPGADRPEQKKPELQTAQPPNPPHTQQQAPSSVPARTGALPSAMRIDGRVRFLSSQGVRQGDQGLFGETLENGSLFIYRWDLRYVWSVAKGVQLVPWLRISNEGDDVLAEGAEQLSNPEGSASLIAQAGGAKGILGAFPLRLSPLLLQRWDAQDAPPLGGVSSCGCGASAAGLQQRSMEILTPFYTFEGTTFTQSTRWESAQTWFSIPHQEREARVGAPIEERALARYRLVHYGASLDLGPSADRDPDFGLPAPVGLRLSAQTVDDDARTLPRTSFRPAQRDESDWAALGRLGPWLGLSADGELVRSQVKTRGPADTWSGWRSGLNGRWAVPAGPSAGGSAPAIAIWARVHRIYTDQGFDPLFRALTYDPNRQGWRFAGGVGIKHASSDKNEWIGASAFYRRVREVDQVIAPGFGREKLTVASVTVYGRPLHDLLAEAHAVRTHVDPPAEPPLTYAQKSTGLSFDLRWEGWPAVDPILRIDSIRREEHGIKTRTYWQGYLSVRVLM